MIVLSIIIINYNYGFFLPRCIKSIARNAVSEPFEVVFIDDASTDDSINIAKAAFAKYQIKNYQIHVNKTNQKMLQARSKGVSLAKGKYITFIDADDQYKDNYFKKVMPILLKNKYNFIQHKVIDVQRRNQTYSISKTRNSPFNFKLAIQKSSHIFRFIFTKTVILQCYTKVKQLSINFREDTVVIAMIPLLENIKYRYFDETAILHDVHQQSYVKRQTAQIIDERWENAVAVYLFIIEQYQKTKKNSNSRKINLNVGINVNWDFCIAQDKTSYKIISQDPRHMKQVELILSKLKPLPNTLQIWSNYKWIASTMGTKHLFKELPSWISSYLFPLFLKNPTLTIKLWVSYAKPVIQKLPGIQKLI